jgi:hypothetical protein
MDKLLENICLKYQKLKFWNYPKKTKVDLSSGNWNTSNQLIHTVSAACRNIPYSDEAAKEARTKLFFMWYSFGPPSVFFTMSPGDECSFRIQLYVNLKMDLLPQPTTDENMLISDLVFRSKLRLDNPGACAREYNSIMQIIMETLVGWNFKEQKQGHFEIFGEFMGWCNTTEEQARYTLHSHVLLFIAQFDQLISLLWLDSEHIRRKAKDELTKYMEPTMSSTYKLLEEDYGHRKRDVEHDDPNSLCRIIPSVVPDQTIRNMRHQRLCHMLKGIKAKCEGCNQTFTSQKIIWNAVDNWVDKLHQQGIFIFRISNRAFLYLNTKWTE